MDFSQMRAYAGALSQLMPTKEYTLSGGRMTGVRAIDVSDGRRLTFTVLPDRCLDLYSVRVDGKSLCYHTPAGITHPAYGDRHGKNWLHSFFGGFLSTCGLTNIGTPGTYQGEEEGQHGAVGNAPAEELCFEIQNPHTQPEVVIRGTLREASLFGVNLALQREIRCCFGEGVIRLRDTIENRGYHTVPYMVLYHFNMGYPLLSENSMLDIPSDDVRPRDAHAAAHAESWRQILPPQDNFTEMCYYHTFTAGGQHRVSLQNPAEKLGVAISFAGAHLDHFVQWKMLERGSYVMGLEPCNATIDGKALADADGSLKTLAPGEATTNEFVIDTNF